MGLPSTRGRGELTHFIILIQYQYHRQKDGQMCYINITCCMYFTTCYNFLQDCMVCVRVTKLQHKVFKVEVYLASMFGLQEIFQHHLFLLDWHWSKWYLPLISQVHVILSKHIFRHTNCYLTNNVQQISSSKSKLKTVLVFCKTNQTEVAVWPLWLCSNKILLKYNFNAVENSKQKPKVGT